MDRMPRGEVSSLIDPSEYSDVIVTVAHPWGDVETTLEQWIRRGPGPRPFVKCRSRADRAAANHRHRWPG